MPTPFLSRTLGRLQDSPYPYPRSPVPASKRKKGLVKPVEQLQALKKGMTPGLWKQVDGLFDAYANVLKATKPGPEKSRKGTRSLMSTCLRQVPRYIVLEEYWAAEDGVDEEERDIGAEIYAELEEYGSGSGHGWRALKEVVRAHGTALLCDAFEERLLGLETLQGLYRLCMNVSAWDEAEKLLGSYLEVMKPLSLPTSTRADFFDPQVSVYMALMKDFVDTTWRHQFFYDQIEYMLVQDLLPLEWLATGAMLPVWNRVVRTLTDCRHRTYANAYRLLETVISMGAGLPVDELDEEAEAGLTPARVSVRTDIRDALNNTFSSVLTLLASIAMVSFVRAEGTDSETARSVTWVLDSLAINLLQRRDIRKDLKALDADEHIEDFARRAVWCVTAPFLVQLSGCQLASDSISLGLPTFISAFNWIVSQYSSTGTDLSPLLEAIPTFISTTVQCCGKAWNTDGFPQLQNLVSALLAIKTPTLNQPSWSLRRIALDSCLEFAQHTKAGEHFTYARQVEKSLVRVKPIVLGNRRASGDVGAREEVGESAAQQSGFRWEEGIGEWVSCTPFTKKQYRRPPPQARPLPLPSPAESEAGVTEKGGKSYGGKFVGNGKQRLTGMRKVHGENEDEEGYGSMAGKENIPNSPSTSCSEAPKSFLGSASPPRSLRNKRPLEQLPFEESTSSKRLRSSRHSSQDGVERVSRLRRRPFHRTSLRESVSPKQTRRSRVLSPERSNSIRASRFSEKALNETNTTLNSQQPSSTSVIPKRGRGPPSKNSAQVHTLPLPAEQIICTSPSPSSEEDNTEVLDPSFSLHSAGQNLQPPRRKRGRPPKKGRAGKGVGFRATSRPCNSSPSSTSSTTKLQDPSFSLDDEDKNEQPPRPKRGRGRPPKKARGTGVQLREKDCRPSFVLSREHTADLQENSFSSLVDEGSEEDEDELGIQIPTKQEIRPRREVGRRRSLRRRAFEGKTNVRILDLLEDGSEDELSFG